MPFKSADRAREWNNAYQRKRSAQARRVRADAESRVLGLVKTSPGRYDTRGLYRVLLSKGFDWASVEGAVKALMRASIVSIDPDSMKLVLNNHVENPFLEGKPERPSTERSLPGLRRR